MRLVYVLVGQLLVALPGLVLADDVLVKDTDGIEVTVSELQDEISIRDPDEQPRLQHDQGAVRDLIMTLFRREKLLREIEKEGIADDPTVKRRVEVARINALIKEAKQYHHDHIDVPDMEGRALEYYKIHPEEFSTKERVRAAHILLKAETDAEKAARRPEMEAIIEELKGGASFADVARKHSEDPGSGARGGDLGWFGRGQMVPTFESAVFALKMPGERSGIVESKFGLHLIQLEEREDAVVRPYEEVKEGLIEKLSLEYRKEKTTAWVKEVTNPISWTVDDVAIDTLTAPPSTETTQGSTAGQAAPK